MKAKGEQRVPIPVNYVEWILTEKREILSREIGFLTEVTHVSRVAFGDDKPLMMLSRRHEL
jgi:hypothetical protein